MSKLLVNAPTGIQDVIDIGQGGAYFDAARVLWDERDDGPLPTITLGGMVRSGSALIYDQSRMDAHIAASAPTVKDYTDAVQKHLDEKAQSKNYDDIVSACSYAGAPNPFQAEGQMFVQWRGAVWAKCYEIMAAVQGGQRSAPTIAELIAELPGIAL